MTEQQIEILEKYFGYGIIVYRDNAKRFRLTVFGQMDDDELDLLNELHDFSIDKLKELLAERENLG